MIDRSVTIDLFHADSRQTDREADRQTGRQTDTTEFIFAFRVRNPMSLVFAKIFFLSRNLNVIYNYIYK